jgi:hypothetical protein
MQKKEEGQEAGDSRRLHERNPILTRPDSTGALQQSFCQIDT